MKRIALLVASLLLALVAGPASAQDRGVLGPGKAVIAAGHRVLGIAVNVNTASSSVSSGVTGTGLWYSSSGTLNSAAVGFSGDGSLGTLSGGNVPLVVSGLQTGAGGTVTVGDGSHATTLQWQNGSAAKLAYSATSATPQTIEFDPQGATAGRSADGVFNLANPGSGASEAALLVEQAGTPLVAISAYQGVTSYGNIYFGPQAAAGTRGLNNWGISSNGTELDLNAASGSFISYNINGGTIFKFQTGFVYPTSDLTTSLGLSVDRFSHVYVADVDTTSGLTVGTSSTSVAVGNSASAATLTNTTTSTGTWSESQGANTMLTLGGNGAAFGEFSSSTTTGTVTLTAAQYARGIIDLTGGALTGNLNVTFPNAAGMWFVDVSGITLGSDTLTLQSGTATCVFSTLSSTTNLIVVHSRGGNTIACN